MLCRRLFGTAVTCLLVAFCCAMGPARAQQTETAPPAGQSATQPTTAPTTGPAEHTPITARVIEVKGDVQHAPLDSDEWQPCKLEDEYPEQTMIRTGVRSSIKFQIGADDTYTALVIEPVSKTLIAEAYHTADTKKVQIGVGYGRIRAGVAEGGLKSDFTVHSPVATLSKRGTWNFGLFYERGTNRFEIFLLDQGLVDAFSKATGQHRAVLPRELVTQVMRRWADQAQMLRNVPIADMLGQSDIEIAFNRLNQDGLAVLDPQGGQTVLINLANQGAQQAFANLIRQTLPPTPLRVTLPGGGPGAITRPEGFFGTGRGDELIAVTIAANSALAQKGFANPGTYNFRRSALEGWLQQRGK